MNWAERATMQTRPLLREGRSDGSKKRQVVALREPMKMDEGASLAVEEDLEEQMRMYEVVSLAVSLATVEVEVEVEEQMKTQL
jgi:hypothetical protein